MTGGIIADWGEFPSSVSIDSPYNIHCGGVVIDKQHILTSAQCVLNSTHQLVNPFWFNVIAGDINLSPSSIRREEKSVEKIYVHDEYNPNTRANDIAVLRVSAGSKHGAFRLQFQFFFSFQLSSPFNLPSNTIGPALRAYHIKRDGASCQLAGWGSRTPTDNPAAIVVEQRVIIQNILDRDRCNEPELHRNRVRESMLCAGSIAIANPPAGPCSGNLGSALYCDGEVTGILSFGINCGEPSNPGVYTQIRFYNNWIDYQLEREDILPAGWSPIPAN